MCKILQKITLLFSLVFLLSACRSPNMLTYKYRPNYHESSIITSDSVFTLNQSVSYNKRGVVDEEFVYELTFKFNDTLAGKTKKVLNLVTDTALVKANYDLFSVWTWGGQKCMITGEIKILKWNKNEVVLKENVTVKDLVEKETKHYRGTRRFTRKKGW